jgi:hypothetical protein
MNKYFYITDITKTKLKSFKAKDEDDFKENISRVEDDPVLFFALDKEEVKEYQNQQLLDLKKKEKEEEALPKEVADYIQYKTEWHRGFQRYWNDCRSNEKIDFCKQTYIGTKVKPFFIRCFWNNGQNFSFCTKDELKDTIIDMKSRNDDDWFDMEIVTYPDGNSVEYTVSYTITLNIVE